MPKLRHLRALAFYAQATATAAVPDEPGRVLAVLVASVYGRALLGYPGSARDWLVGRVGIEPTTSGLKVRCSTD